MGSDLAAEGLGWLAAAFAGLSLGAAAAWGFRARALHRGGRAGASRRALSLLYLGLSAAVAAGAALLILPPKPLLADRGLWLWAGAWGGFGCLAALFPARAGAPLAVLGLSVLGLAASEAAAWHSLVPGREAARFVPYGVTETGAAGDLSVPDRNAVPVLSRTVLAGARDCLLEARVLDLYGPAAALFGPRRYVLVRLADGEGASLLDFPRKPGPLGGLLNGAGRSLGWAASRTVRSPAAPLEELRALSWSFDPEGMLAVRTP